jgi:site-specific recombinase XerD
LNDYLDRWLEVGAKPRVRPRTFDSYADVLARYVRPLLGDKLLGEINPLDVLSVVTKMQEEEPGPRSIRYALVVLKQALRQAVEWRLLPSNPAENIRPPRQVKHEMQALSVDQACLFCAACQTRRGAGMGIRQRPRFSGPSG